MTSQITNLVSSIQNSQKIIISTHRHCDGDGLGAEIAMYKAMLNMNKEVVIFNVDRTPKKYHFLESVDHIKSLDDCDPPSDSVDLILIFDTNDSRLLEPLFSHFTKIAKKIIFIDHHPLLKSGPHPTIESYIDPSAASTGELTYRILTSLKVTMTPPIAEALYMSITFDTQLFKFIRNSSNSHLIAAELLKQSFDPLRVHSFLFGNHSVNKIKFLGHMINKIEYYYEFQLAVLTMTQADQLKFNIDPDDTRDIIDIIMGIDSLRCSVILTEQIDHSYKLSFRSKPPTSIIEIAEKMGGGGHLHAAGAFTKESEEEIKKFILHEIKFILGTQ